MEHGHIGLVPFSHSLLSAICQPFLWTGRGNEVGEGRRLCAWHVEPTEQCRLLSECPFVSKSFRPPLAETPSNGSFERAENSGRDGAEKEVNVNSTETLWRSFSSKRNCEESITHGRQLVFRESDQFIELIRRDNRKGGGSTHDVNMGF